MKTKLGPGKGTGMVVLLVTAVLLAASMVPSVATASVWADAGGKGGGMPGKWHHRAALGIWQRQLVIERVGLSKDQVQQLRDADFSSREKRLELNSRLDQMRLQLDKAFSQAVSDKKAVRQLAQAMAEVKEQLFVRYVEDRLVLETILSFDQIQKLKLDRMHRKRGEPGIGLQRSAKDYLAGRFDGGDCRRSM